MKNTLRNEKLMTIFILPIMWLVYFLFEVVTGRVTNLYTLILNLSLVFVFALVGFIIHKLSVKHKDGFSTKHLLIIFMFLMLIDQGIKIIIKYNFFDLRFDIIPNFLSFDPIINTKGSWLNARFNFNIGFSLLIIFNGIALLFFYELYRYIKYNCKFKNFWIDMCFQFIFTGALCSFIDKIFYGGSLDFIGISDLFIADIKDIYINLGLLFFIMAIYKSGYLKGNDDSSLKDDWQTTKNFINFIVEDFKSIFKKGKAK